MLPKFLCLCFAMCLASQGAAQSGSSDISRLKLSAQLFAAGQNENDPLLMIAAAKIRQNTNLTPAEGSKALDWSMMLDRAAAMASDNDMLTELIEDIRAERDKGVASGPVYSLVEIRGGGTDEYAALPFSGGAYAEVYIEGKGDSDLNLFIYDAQDRLVCSDTDISDIAYCGWRPASTSAFRVEVRNRGDQTNQYALITN